MQMGLTQTELGRVLGVDQSVVSRWETGELIPSDKHKAAIFRFSGGQVRPDDLYEFVACA